MLFFSQDASFLIYFIGLSIIAYVRVTDYGYIKYLLLSSINVNAARQIKKSDFSDRSPVNFLLSVNFYFSLSLFLCFFAERIKIIPEEINKFYFFLIVFVASAVFVFLNRALNFISSRIFYLKDAAEEFNEAVENLYRALGIILLIVNILISFSSFEEIAFFAGFVFIGIFWLLRIFRYVKINLQKHTNSLYLFLYLCTVEIIPVLYFIKILTVLQTTTN